MANQPPTPLGDLCPAQEHDIVSTELADTPAGKAYMPAGPGNLWSTG